MKIDKIFDFRDKNNSSNDVWSLFISEKNDNTNNKDLDINEIFHEAIKKWASDIHIEPDENVLNIRFRVDWHLIHHKTFGENFKSVVIAKIKVLWWLKIDERRLPQDWKAIFKDIESSDQIDLRISIIPTIYWEKAAIRLLKKENEWINLRSIWILPMNMVKIKKHLSDNFWLCLVVWPTWSWKSTTLYAMLSTFDTNEKNISTLEDPVEYRIKWVNHTQINPAINFNFADWLRSLLRQDPDIIMVWEIRDSETSKLAVEASITWHLVFSTIHANSSVSTIQRLINLWIDPLLIVSSIRLIISQRLARKLCNHCKIKYVPDEQVKNKIIKRIWRYLNEEELFLYRANENWCEHCNSKWHKWRTWIYEILEMTEWLEKLILSWASKTQLEIQAIWDWMINIKDDSLLKVVLWEISLEEVFNILGA